MMYFAARKQKLYRESPVVKGPSRLFYFFNNAAKNIKSYKKGKQKNKDPAK